jgi:hypothetical protein
MLAAVASAALVLRVGEYFPDCHAGDVINIGTDFMSSYRRMKVITVFTVNDVFTNIAYSLIVC